MHSIPSASSTAALPDWVDDGEYVVLDMNDPAVRARYEEFARRRDYLIPAEGSRPCAQDADTEPCKQERS